MTNFRDQPQYDDIAFEGDAEGRQLVAELSDLYRAPVPALPFEPRREPESTGLRGLLRVGWRPVLGSAAVAAVVAAALLAVSPWSRDSQVSAEAIFARTSQAAQTNAPAGAGAAYHLVAVTEVPSEPGSRVTTETWYTDSRHRRTEEDWTPENETPDFGLAVNGEEAWLYGAFDGAYRVAHGASSELGMTFGAPSQALDVGQVLGQYAGGCQAARQDGEETIANRPAYRIRVTPDAVACAEMAGVPAEDVLLKLGELTVWVDKETFLPLKTEQTLPGGGVSVYTVTQIEVGGEITDSTFAYHAPEGVSVWEVANMSEAKNVLSGHAPDGTPQ